MYPKCNTREFMVHAAPRRRAAWRKGTFYQTGMLIIPAIDILDGKCVRLTRGEYVTQKIYGDPLKFAKQLESDGARMLHVVDLNGARDGAPANRELIMRICSAVSIPVEVGGGIRKAETARAYLAAEAARVVTGTRAMDDMDFVGELIREFGASRIVVALEIKGGKVAVKGWQSTVHKDYRELARELKARGVTELLFTDVERDGTLTEPNFEVVRELAALGFNVIASGGVSDVQAIRKLRELGAASAIIGKALYEEKMTLGEAEEAARPLSGLAKRIVPCLDVKDGKVVKGISFENLQIVGDPAALGKKYSAEGADELVFLDISASKEGRETMFSVVEQVAKEVFIPFTVGGGISSVEQMRRLLHLGAEKVSINTAAVKDPSLITAGSKAFGSQAIVVAIDAKRVGTGWKVFLRGGSEETQLDAIAWAKEAETRGAGEILLTSMDKDGQKSGYDIELLRRVSEAVRIPVVASGGAGSLEDLKRALTDGSADAALVASLFHYGEYSITDAKEYLAKEGISMRT